MNTHNDLLTCFVAYPSNPQAVAEAMEEGITLINETGTAHLIGWKELKVSGKIVIQEICDEIDRSDIFICEITHLNPNVLFELGYAVAKNKRVWLVLDNSYPNASSNFKQVKALTTIGYSPYHNANELRAEFLREHPYLDKENTLYSKIIQPILLSQPRKPSLLYLKSSIETVPSTRLTRLINQSSIPIITDDPAEVAIQSIVWYVENVYHCCAVIAHLLDEERAKPGTINNAKYAFVSGLAYGLGKPLLILAHSPYSPPFDYQDLLHVHTSANDCTTVAQNWIQGIKDIQSQEHETQIQAHSVSQSAATLQRIYLGDYLAENEQLDLLDYFIPTAAYNDAFHTRQSMVYVGRKGTGKTANLYKLADELARDKSNHVCILRPVDYDLQGVVRLLSMSIPLAEHGYLMQSLWKYLIYTQLAISYYERLDSQSPYIQITDDEKLFILFIHEHSNLIQPDFTVRLEEVVANLCRIDFVVQPASNRAKVSEVLHTQVLAQLRTQLGKVMGNKHKICVLIDNLDKAWALTSDLPPLSEFIFGLLSVSRDITEEFQRVGSAWRSANVSVLVFLRSDIFSYLTSQAREADKLIFSRIDWEDERLLQRIIEDRFLASLQIELPPDEIWIRYFTSTVNSLSVKDYLISKIVPRPRDIIYICKAALSHAVNRGHIRIEEDDILLAEKDYSYYAYLTLVSEIKPYYPQIENFLIEFAGSSDIITKTEIEIAITKASLPSEMEESIINLLIESLFLGLEVEKGVFKFLYDYNKRDVFKALARATMESSSSDRYYINTPFHSYLEIKHSNINF